MVNHRSYSVNKFKNIFAVLVLSVFMVTINLSSDNALATEKTNNKNAPPDETVIKSPGERLVAHFDGLAEVAGKHTDDCDKMAESMEKYLQDNEKDIKEVLNMFEYDKLTEIAKKKLERNMDTVMEKLYKNIEKCEDNERVVSATLVIPFMMAAAMDEK